MKTLVLIAALAFAACAAPVPTEPPAAVDPVEPGAGVKDWNTVVLRLERGPCFGRCPIYNVEIRGDGSVAYEGVNFVAATGEQTRQIAPEAVRALVARFEAADFFDLAPEYRGDITDGVTNRTTFAHDGQSHTVVNYMGSLAGMPEVVYDLEEAIDEVAGTKEWVGQN
jgi:hypothetical protein